jgi:hypothetical protein
LNKFCCSKYLFAFLLFLSVLFWHSNLSASDLSTLWGQIVDEGQRPLRGVKITLTSQDKNFSQSLSSDAAGFFRCWGLPFGFYTLRLEPKKPKVILEDSFYLEPPLNSFLKIKLHLEAGKEGLDLQILSPDFPYNPSQTIISRSQIQSLPSGNNLWSLVENQDYSAVTNRIDVGGIWGSIPSLFSSRGSCSWTQNTYLLNGLDVTDPYWTGTPLFFPDFYSLHYTQLITADHPIQSSSPGGSFNLVTEEGGPEFHSGLYAFHTNRHLKSSNVSARLEKEGIFESNSLDYSLDGNFHLSGALIPKKLYFFTSITGLHLSRDLAEYEREDDAFIYSGLVDLKYLLRHGDLHFLWTGQNVQQPSFGAGRKIPFSATVNQKNLYNVLQAIWNSRIGENHLLKVGLGFNRSNLRSHFQEGSSGQHGLEIFTNIPSGPAASAKSDDRSVLNFFIRGESALSNSLGNNHRLEYGFELQRSFSSSKEEVLNNIHLHFFEGEPLEIVQYNSPFHHRESALHLKLYAQETLTFSNFLSVSFGLQLLSSRGWVPSQIEEKNRIHWLNLSPHLSFTVPFSRDGTTALKLSAARLYFTLPLSLLTYGNPGAPGGLVYAWEDKNHDRYYEEGEATILLRREGPYFAQIDPNLKRPYSDEYMLSLMHSFGSGWSISLAGFYRENRNLIGTANIGVPFSDYESSEFFDSGDDRIPGTHDDLTFTIFNQKRSTLGKDFFLLTNPYSETRITRYRGLDLILVKKYSPTFFFFLALTATEVTGTTSPGNTEWENDDGVVGSLYENPNTLINAKGRLNFDRGYTGRIGLSFRAPWGLRIGSIVKYYDGQPFARKIIIRGMNQGPFYIMAHPRGVSRYEFNMTVDIRVEKSFDLGKAKMRIVVDGFNIFNWAFATAENEWTGPEWPLRFATEIQSPRIFRIGLAYEF